VRPETVMDATFINKLEGAGFIQSVYKKRWSFSLARAPSQEQATDMIVMTIDLYVYIRFW